MDESPQKTFHSLSETEAQSGLSIETEKNVLVIVDPQSAGTSIAPKAAGDEAYSKLKERRDNVILFSVVATIFAVPLIVFTTARKNATIGGVPTSGLTLWLFVGWCTFCMTAVFLWGVKMLWKMFFDVLEDPLKAPLSAFVGDVEDAAGWSVVFGVLYGVRSVSSGAARCIFQLTTVATRACAGTIAVNARRRGCANLRRPYSRLW